mgnify:CR=1 FL=1
MGDAREMTQRSDRQDSDLSEGLTEWLTWTTLRDADSLTEQVVEGRLKRAGERRRRTCRNIYVYMYVCMYRERRRDTETQASTEWKKVKLRFEYV